MIRAKGRDGLDDSVRLFQLMSELGFDRAATQVYGVVLTCGPVPQRAIVSMLSGVSTEVGSALRQLQERGLVGSVYRRLRRRQYYAISPSIAWRSLSSELVWRTSEAIPAGNSAPGICDEIATVGSRLYRPYAAALAHHEWDAATADEFAQLICEAMGQARRTIVAVSTSPRLPQVASFWATMSDPLAVGVTYRRVVDLDEVIAHGLKIVTRDIEEHGIDVMVLERDRIHQKFYVVDGSFLAVFHRQEQAREGGADPGVGRITTRGTILRRYARRFRQYADLAIPGRFVVRRLEMASEELLECARERLGGDDVAWVESLVHYGTFSRLPVARGWSRDDTARAEERAIEIGVVRRNLDGDLVPAYPVTEADIRDHYEASRREEGDGFLR
jgi:hypothetical protein